MKQETITVVRKKAGEDAEVVTIPNTLESLQAEVGGYIEVLPVGSGILMILNEEGKFLPECKPNFNFYSDVIMGNVIFVKSEGEEFAGLDKAESDAVLNWLA